MILFITGDLSQTIVIQVGFQFFFVFKESIWLFIIDEIVCTYIHILVKITL